MYLSVGRYHLCVLVRLCSVSVEDRGVGPLDDLTLSEQTFPPQDGAGLRYSALISGEINRDGERHKHTICYYTLHILKFSYSVQTHTQTHFIRGILSAPTCSFAATLCYKFELINAFIPA